MKRTKHQEKNAERFAEYRAWLATQPCALCGIGLNVQLAHVGIGGTGLKHGDDDQCIPLCGPRFTAAGCHFDHDNTRGEFLRPRWFPKDPWRQAMRDWAEIQVAAHRGRFEARGIVERTTGIPF